MYGVATTVADALAMVIDALAELPVWFASPAFVDYLAAWVDRYPILSVEDGMAEDD